MPYSMLYGIIYPYVHYTGTVYKKYLLLKICPSGWYPAPNGRAQGRVSSYRYAGRGISPDSARTHDEDLSQARMARWDAKKRLPLNYREWRKRCFVATLPHAGGIHIFG